MEYRKLGADYIRVLEVEPGHDTDPIRCWLTLEHLDSPTPYNALSYAWGVNTRTRLVYINRLPCLVTQSVCKALQHLRKPEESFRIWVDLVCINQDDSIERSSQVRLMSRIYSLADRVIAWLGVPTLQWKNVFPSIKAYVTGNLPARRLRREATSFHELLRCPWFARLWIVQEMVAAQECVLSYGTFTCDLSIMFRFIRKCDEESALWLPSDASSSARSNLFSLAITCGMREEFREGYKDVLVSLIHNTRGMRCSDPRDHIFALVGIRKTLEPPEYAVNIDYASTPASVFSSFTRSMLLADGRDERTRDANWLFSDHLKDSDERHTLDALPSWVPDWSYESPLLPYFPERYRAGGSSVLHMSQCMFSNSFQSLTWEGFSLCTVKRAQVLKANQCFNDMYGLEIAAFKSLCCKCPYRSALDRRQAFWRTVIADSLEIEDHREEGQGRWPQEILAGLIANGQWKTHPFRSRFHLRRNRSPREFVPWKTSQPASGVILAAEPS